VGQIAIVVGQIAIVVGQIAIVVGQIAIVVGQIATAPRHTRHQNAKSSSYEIRHLVSQPN
jgi:hypothetical protein